MSRRGLACALLTCTVGGCSVLFAPSDDLTVGRGDGGVATTSGKDASSTKDGSSADDVACPSDALFCDDFERAPTSVQGTFDSRSGEVAISTETAHSGTRSLSATLRENRPVPYLEAALETPSKITLSFWFRSPSAPTSDYKIRLAHLLWGPPCDWDFTWQFSLRRQGLLADVGTYDEDTNPSCGPVDFGGFELLSAAETFVPKWHHVTVTHDVSSASRSATVQVDDKPPMTSTLRSRRATPLTRVSFSIGAPCVQTNGGCLDWDGGEYVVFIDDISIVATK